MSNSIKRVLTGMRLPSPIPGRALHLGHLVGALNQWVPLQYEPGLQLYFLLADTQSLGTHANQPDLIERSKREVILDWIAAGIDPNLPNVHFVLQSQILSRSTLFELFLSRSTLAQAQHNPTIIEEMKSVEARGESVNLLFLTHGINQAADILMMSPLPGAGNELLVPVGADQLALIAECRAIADRFNNAFYPMFVKAESQLSEVPRLVGLQGPNSGKMGKSAEGSAIFLADTADEVAQKVKGMYTDPNRPRWQDPGTPEGLAQHVPLVFLRAFSPDAERVKELEQAYLAGGIKDGDIKNELVGVLNDLLDPMRERRHVAAQSAFVDDYVYDGTYKANKIANGVLLRLWDALHIPNTLGLSHDEEG